MLIESPFGLESALNIVVIDLIRPEILNMTRHGLCSFRYNDSQVKLLANKFNDSSNRPKEL